MGSLPVVVVIKGGGDFAHLLKGRGVMLGKTLLLIGAVVAFDKAILLWVVRLADQHYHPQGLAKTQQSGREVAALGSPDPAGVPVEGNGVGQSMCLKRLGHGQQRRFCRKIGTDMTG